MSFLPMSFPLPPLCYLELGSYIALRDPVAHALLLHPHDDHESGHEYAFLCTDNPGWVQRPIALRALPAAVAAMEGQTNVYLSLNRFSSQSRKTNKCTALTSCYVDVDCYKNSSSAHAGDLQLVLFRCAGLLFQAGVPLPSLIMFTGRGLAFVWLICPAPPTQLAVWNRVQAGLTQVLRPLGSDSVSKDASHVFRLIGTTNGKSGNTVQAYALDRAERWPLERLAAVFPAGEEPTVPCGRVLSPDVVTRKRSPASRNPVLWVQRYRDILRLIRIRFGRLRLPPGQRDQYLHLLGVALSWIPSSRPLFEELVRIAGRLAEWDETECRSRFSALLRPTSPAKYRYKTQTIIDDLKITPEEQQRLRVLVSEEILAQRQAARGTGRVSRSKYEEQRAFKAEMLRITIYILIRVNKLTHKECAARLGISIETVRSALYRHPPPKALPVF